MKPKTHFDNDPTYYMDGETDRDEPEETAEIDFDGLTLQPEDIQADCPIEENFRAVANSVADARRYLARGAGRFRAPRSVDKEPSRIKRSVARQNDRARDDASGELDPEQWERWRDAFGGVCAYCGEETAHECIEHVVPVGRRGKNTIFNVVPACHGCNMSKGPKDAIRWMQKWGHLNGFTERVCAALQKAEDPKE